MSDNREMLSEKEIRRLRVKRIKKALVTTLVVSILIPIITCIVLCIKVAGLEADIRLLMSERESLSSVVEDGLELTQNLAGDEQVESEGYSADVMAAEETSEESTEPESTVPVENKKVYLTFDDGPSANTSQILDILDVYGVKATFFVVGKTDEESAELYRRIAESGNSLGMHSYSHRYNTVYASVESFAQDVESIRQLIISTTGVEPVLYRFPGGSSNTVSTVPMESFISYLNEQNITYFDWNVSSQDASSNNISADDIYNNVIQGITGYESSVVLMHDTEYKDTTVEALPRIIETLKEMGVEILPITSEVDPIQHIKADEINQ